MKNKRILISLGIIAALILYLVISRNMGKGGNVPDLKRIDKIDELQVINSKEAMKLELKGDKWFVNDEYPTDKVNSEKLADAVKDLKFSDYITREHHVIYDLSKDKAIQVIAKYEGKVLRDILVGKTSSTNRTTYVKLSDDDRVYLAIGDLKSTYDVNLQKMRDMQIYKFEKNDISWFQINYKKKTLSFEKKVETVDAEDVKGTDADIGPEPEKEPGEKKQKTVEKWICAEYPKAAISKSKVDSYLNTLSAVRAEYYPDVKKDELKGLICLAKAKIADKEITMSVIAQSSDDEKSFYCSSSESPYVFVMRDYAVKKYYKELKDFTDTKK